MVDKPPRRASFSNEESLCHTQHAEQGPRRLQVRLACDACRRRKTRCDLGPHRATQADSRKQADPDAPTLPRDSTSPCGRCLRLGVPCTFLMPTRPRGPKKGSAPSKRPALTRSIRSSSSPRLGSTEPDLEDTRTPRDGSTRATRSLSGLPQSPGGGGDLRGPPTLSAPTSPGTTSYSGNLDHDLPPRDSPSPVFPSDKLCSRRLYTVLIQDFIDFIYPSVPMVHLPSFQRDVANNRDLVDAGFSTLTISVCALVVATMRDRFDVYRAREPLLRFRTRTEMVHCCHEMIIHSRGVDYFDEIDLQKWATSYALTVAYFQVGCYNQERMLEVESMQLARLLDLHNPSSYINLSCIEAQLRKKAFWLMFYAYVHSQLQNVHREKLTFIDALMLRNMDLRLLLPSPVDDDYISEDCILTQPEGQTSLTVAFIYHSLTFWASMKSTATGSDPSQPGLECMEIGSVQEKRTFLQQRLHDLKYVLDDVPEYLRPWAMPLGEPAVPVASEMYPRRPAQLESLRIDLHVTQLWLQSVILGQMESLEMSTTPDKVNSTSAWEHRESLCRQVLHVLHNLSQETLQPIGNHVTHKLRDMAVTLLPEQPDVDERIAKRRTQYLRDFASVISLVDGNEVMTTLSAQSWVDSARCKQWAGPSPASGQ